MAIPPTTASGSPPPIHSASTAAYGVPFDPSNGDLSLHDGRPAILYGGPQPLRCSLKGPDSCVTLPLNNPRFVEFFERFLSLRRCLDEGVNGTPLGRQADQSCRVRATHHLTVRTSNPRGALHAPYLTSHPASVGASAPGSTIFSQVGQAVSDGFGFYGARSQSPLSTGVSYSSSRSDSSISSLVSAFRCARRIRRTYTARSSIVNKTRKTYGDRST